MRVKMITRHGPSPRRSRATWPTLLTIGVIVLGITGCSGAASSAPTQAIASAPPAPATTGAVGTSMAPTSSTAAPSFQNYTACVDDITGNLDPAQASDQPAFQFTRATYETLVNYDPVKAALVGALADSWQASSDATSYTLHLRANVTFHDGSALTADGVKASLQRTLAIGKGESSLIGDIQSIDVVDPSTIKITLKAADADLLFNLTRIFIVSGSAIQTHATSADPNAAAWFAQNEDGSGPYKLTTWTPSQDMILDHFAGYWQGWSGSHIGQYKMQVVPQEATQRLMLQRGQCDSANAITPDDAAALQSDASLTVAADPGSPMYITFNPAGPLKDVHVRQAIAEAMDYTSVDQQIMKGFAKRLAGPATPGLWAYNTSLQPTSYNLTDAKQLLQAAGYGPSHPLTLTLQFFNLWTFEADISALLQNSLAQIGVTLKVQGMPWATFSANAENPATRPDMGLLATYVPTPSPGPVISSTFDPASEGGWAYWGYNNPSATALLHQAETDPNDTTRATEYQQLQQMLVEDYAAMWLMEQPDIFVFQKAVQGYVHDTAWGIILNYYGIHKEG